MEEEFLDPKEREAGPFAVGKRMRATGLENDEGDILVRVQAGGKESLIPLADVEVAPKSSRNYWPVREWVVWVANCDW